MIPAAVAVLNNEMRYVCVSNRWATDYKLEPAEIIGLSHYDVFPNIPERWKQFHQRCLQGERISAKEDQFIREDGRIDWVRWELVPLENDDGVVTGIIIFTEVITDLKNASDDLSHLLFETIQAIAKTIESRDPYTAGHQHRVSILTRAMALGSVKGRRGAPRG